MRALLALAAVMVVCEAARDFPDDLPVVRSAVVSTLPDSFCPVTDPPKMDSVVTAVQDKTVKLTWKNLSKVYEISEYHLSMSIQGMPWQLIYKGMDSSFNLMPFSKTDEYRFRVKAINCASGSAWSDTTLLTPLLVVDRPTRPEAVDVTSDSLRLNWRPCVDNPLSHSVIQMHMGDGPWMPGLQSDLYEWRTVYDGIVRTGLFDELAPGQWYWFRLAYSTGVSTHVWSRVTAVRTQSRAPGMPRAPSFEYVGEAAIRPVPYPRGKASWEVPDNGGSALTVQSLYLMSRDLDDDYQQVCDGATPYCEVALRPGKHYSMYVIASNSVGDSPPSITTYFAVPPSAPAIPAPPTLLVADTKKISIQWKPPLEDGGSPITGYVLARGDGRALPFKRDFWNGNKWSYEDDEIFRTSHYRYSVAALNNIGRSDYSDPMMAKSTTRLLECAGGEGDGCFGNGVCNFTGAGGAPIMVPGQRPIIPMPKCDCRDDGDGKWTLDDCTGIACDPSCVEGVGVCNYMSGLCNCTRDNQLRPSCDIWKECPNNCSNVGTCNEITGTCECPASAGPVEPDCSFDCGARGNCSGHGRCVAFETCECDEGYGQADCSEPACDLVNGCSGHGKCARPNECECEMPWMGRDCGQLACPNNCMGRGLCVGALKCECDDGYSGQSCQLIACPKGCSGHGDCTAPQNCECWAGWSDDDCSVPQCDEVNECSGRGECVGAQLCQCTVEGWGGPSCDAPLCGDDCNGNGNCVAPLTCDCDRGWSGDTCAVAQCDKVDECSGHGNCSKPNVCTCDEGWGGTKCADALCDDVAYCSLHGDCVAPQTCDCFKGYGASDCATRTLPTNGIFLAEGSEKIISTSPVLTGMVMGWTMGGRDSHSFTIEGWFAVLGVGTRVYLARQDMLFEMYVSRRYAVNKQPPMASDGSFTNPHVLTAVIKTTTGDQTVSALLTATDDSLHHISVSVSVGSGTMTLTMDSAVVNASTSSDFGFLGFSDSTLEVGGGVVKPGAADKPSLRVHLLRVWKQALTPAATAELMKSSLLDSSYFPVHSPPVQSTPDIRGKTFLTGRRLPMGWPIAGGAEPVLQWVFNDQNGDMVTDSSGAGFSACNGKMVMDAGTDPWEVLDKPPVKPAGPPLSLNNDLTDLSSGRALAVVVEPPSDAGASELTAYQTEVRPPPATVSTRRCAELGWPAAAAAAGKEVCASRLPSCVDAATKDQAEQMCVEAGARLCSWAELEDGAAAGAPALGCAGSADGARVWSATSCAGAEKYYSGSGAPSGKYSAPKKCTAVGTAAAVVCCADRNSHVASDKTCSELVVPADTLGWAQTGDALRAKMCSLAPVLRCATSYAEAASTCASVGGRLCRAAELAAGLVENKCGADAKAWSSDRCKDPQSDMLTVVTLVGGGGGSPSCADEAGGRHNIVCCADSADVACTHLSSRCELRPPDNALLGARTRVRALSYAGPGAFTPWSDLTATSGPPTPPPAPPTLQYSSTTTAAVAWVAAVMNGAPVLEYALEVRDVRGGADTRTNEDVSTLIYRFSTSPDTRSVAAHSLLPGIQYAFRVSARNVHGWGALGPALVTVTAAALPAPVQRLQAALRGPDKVRLEWLKPPTDGGLAITSYVVRRQAVHKLKPFSPDRDGGSSPDRADDRYLNARSAKLVEVHRCPANAEGVYLFTDVRVSPATGYRYEVSGITDVGESEPVLLDVQTLTHVPDMDKVKLKSSPEVTGPDYFRVAWDEADPSGAAVAEYAVEARDAAVPGAWEPKCSVEPTVTQCAVKEVRPGRSYIVRLLARNCKGWAVAEDTMLVRTKTAPPSGLSPPFLRKAAQKGLVVQWAEATHNGDQNLEYVLEMREDVAVGSDDWTEAYSGIKPAAILAKLKPNTAYRFRVTASNSAGPSPPSATSPPIRTLRAAPDVPTAPELQGRTGSSLSFSWQATALHGLPFTFATLSYRSGGCRSNASSAWQQAFPPRVETSFVITGLEADAPYCVQLQIANSEGLSGPVLADTRTGSPLPSRPHPPRLSTTVDRTDFSLPVEWARPKLAPSAKVQYDLEIKKAVPGLGVGVGAPQYEVVASNVEELGYTVTSLLPDTSYTLRVRASTRSGSQYSAPATFSTLSADATDVRPSSPDTPSGLTQVDAGADEVLVSWEPVEPTRGEVSYVVVRTAGVPTDLDLDGRAAEDITDLLTGRRYDRPGAGSAGSITEVCRGPSTHCRVTELQPGFSYGFRVEARTPDSPVAPAPSAMLRADTLPTAPGQPAPVMLAQRSATQLRVQWRAPNDGGARIRGYKLTVSEGSYTHTHDVGADQDLNHTFTGLVPAQTYTFTVSAHNDAEPSGQGPDSETAAFRTLPAGPSQVPLLLATPKTTRVQLQWQASTAYGSAVVGYLLEVADHKDGVAYDGDWEYLAHVPAQTQEYIATDLTPSNLYSFRVFALAAAGISPESKTVSLRTVAAAPRYVQPPRVAGTTATSVELEWDEPPERGAPVQSYALTAAPDPAGVVTVGEASITTVEQTKAELGPLPLGARIEASVNATNAEGTSLPAPDGTTPVRLESACYPAGWGGGVCSGRGICLGGRCRCDPTTAGRACERDSNLTGCSVWGGGHVLPYDAGLQGLPLRLGRAVGYHLLGREAGVAVHALLQPLLNSQMNATGVRAVRVEAGGQELTVLGTAAGGVEIQLGCGGNLAPAAAQGLSFTTSDGAFGLRRDAVGRWVLSVADSEARVVVEPWGGGWLSVHVALPVETNPAWVVPGETKDGGQEGICAGATTTWSPRFVDRWWSGGKACAPRGGTVSALDAAIASALGASMATDAVAAGHQVLTMPLGPPVPVAAAAAVSFLETGSRRVAMLGSAVRPQLGQADRRADTQRTSAGSRSQLLPAQEPRAYRDAPVLTAADAAAAASRLTQSPPPPVHGATPAVAQELPVPARGHGRARLVQASVSAGASARSTASAQGQSQSSFKSQTSAGARAAVGVAVAMGGFTAI